MVAQEAGSPLASSSLAAQLPCSNLLTLSALWVFLKDKQPYHAFPQPPSSTIGNLQLGMSLFTSQPGQILRAGPVAPFLAGKGEDKGKSLELRSINLGSSKGFLLPGGVHTSRKCSVLGTLSQA